MTGYTRPLYFLTGLHPDVPVSPGCLCAFVFLLLLVFPLSSALRIRRAAMQGSITVTLSRARASALGGLPAFRGLPALHGLPPSCPSRAPFIRRLCPWQACFRPFGDSLSFAGFLPFAGPLPLTDFAGSLVSFERLVLKFSGPSRVVCSLFSNSLFIRFRAVCSLFSIL